MKESDLDALTYSIVDLFEKDDYSTSEVFHESTKITRRNYAELSRRSDFIQRDPNLVLMMSRAYKTYAGHEKLALPRASLGDMTLEDALRRRRSHVGKYTGEPITLEQLGATLRYSYGPTFAVESRMFPGEKIHYRSAASAGALYPLEIYPLVFNVTGCEPGIYHYNVLEHSFDVLRRTSPLDDFLKLTTYYDLSRTSAAMLVITAVMPRTIAKYLFRGYRFVSYDVGVLLQNLYLTTTAQELGACAVGGFFDDEVGKLIGTDNVDEVVTMLFSIGRLPPNSAPVKHAASNA